LDTGRKLSLGFGALLLILLVTALVVMGRLDRLEQRLREITAFAEPASAAAYEMEIGVAGIGLSVLRYLDTPTPELRERMASQEREFHESRARHGSLAKASEQKETGARIGRLFLDYAGAGLALMDGVDRRRRLAVDLGHGFERAGQRVFGELRSGITGKGRARAQKLEGATKLSSDLAEVGNWLGHYTRTLNPAHRTRMLAGTEELGAELTRFEALALTPQERLLAEQARRPLGDLMAQVRELADLEQAERQRLGRFLDLRAELDAALRGETQLMAERDLLVAKDSAHGSLRVIRSTVFLLLAGGLLVGAATALAFGRGIVRAENDLKAERERLRVTLSSIGDGVIVTDRLACVTFLNPIAQAVTGWSPADATGRPLREVFFILDEHSRKPADDPVGKALRGDVAATLAHRTVLVSRDGSERPIDDSAAPIRSPDGEVTGAVLVFRDISERRRTERLVDEALHYAQGAVENLWVPLLVLDSNLRVMKASRSFCETFRVRPQDTEGRTLDELGEGQWDIPRLGVLLAQVLSHDADVRHFELEAEFRELGPRTLQLDASRFAASGGADDLILLVIEDITERRRLEQALQQRTRALEDADRRKDEFLAMLGHELRNPLAPVRNCLEILKSETLDSRAREECREMMERQVRHLTRLTDDLLDVSRITRGRIELRKEPLDLRKLVTSGLEAIVPERDPPLHGVRASLCAEPVPLVGDPLRLGQVLANLVNNAMQYRTDKSDITVSVAIEEGMGVLRVRDHGIGVEAAMLPRIFEPFVQVDSSLARSRGGLGIGLALVKGLVEMHGGTVSASSEGPGRGSEFTVRLPLAARAEKAVAPPAAADARAGYPRRILVVEDNRDSAESLSMLLTLAGHEVRVAHDGASAIAAARDYRPQVILLDIGLPGMDGFEAARRLRGEPGLDGTLLVAMTGYGQAQDRQRSKSAGFDRHLTKPVEPGVLYGLLREPGGVKDPLGTD
jgi:PAS domain S-box-containing protein